MGTSVSRAALAHLRNIFAALLAALLAFTLVPPAALAADGEGTHAATPSEGSHAEASGAEEGEGASAADAAAQPSAVPSATIAASSLIGKPTAFVSADVALVDDAEPVVGSFTVDGLTVSISDDGTTLVAVAPAEDPEGALGSEVPTSPRPPSRSSAGMLALPGNVAYDGVDYDVTAIGPYAFYLSGATEVSLPETIASVDERAFRSSDVARVEVDSANPNYASFDGALYSADLSSLLLIPEGRAGAILLPKTAEVVEASRFSHCSLVDAISVEEGGAAFASWEGLLYDAAGETLLRVSAGATDITIREGCTTIAAGAMEGCARLESINAPASVTSISPDVFESVSAIAFPSLDAQDDSSESAEDSERPSQVSGVVMLAVASDGIRKVDPARISVNLPNHDSANLWLERGMSVEGIEAIPEAQSSSAYADWNAYNFYVDTNGGIGFSTYTYTTWTGVTGWPSSSPGNTATAESRVYARDGNGELKYGVFSKEGDTLVGWCRNNEKRVRDISPINRGDRLVAIWDSQVRDYPITYVIDPKEGTHSNPSSYTYSIGADLSAATPQPGFRFDGWTCSSSAVAASMTPRIQPLTAESLTFTANFTRVDYDVSFDVDSEPGDVDYPGDPKPEETISKDSGAVEIENPTRPGYVFQGWVIPNAGGTEAVDQELVYEGDDGKWYVDASKLPDYATDGKVELTARWTSVISVDVPNSVTFYADTVTQGSESRDGLADRAFGQSKVQSQSQVDLRIVGLESQEAKGDGGSSLGASDVLVSKGALTPADSAWKLFSLYPSKSVLTPEDLQDPDRVSEAPTGGVTFGLDDVLLEKSFSADDFTIPAGDTLSLGYRLNLEETGTSLDYGKLSQLPEGSTAALANISYCFAADYALPFWTTDDDGAILGLASIKADAEAIAAGDSSIATKYSRWMNEDHRFYVRWFDKGVAEENARPEDDSTVYEVRIIGISHDNKADGSGMAGLTFQFVDCLDRSYAFAESDSVASWTASSIRRELNGGSIWAQAPASLKRNVLTVTKASYDNGAKLTTQDTFFLISLSELITEGTVWPNGSDAAPNGWGELAKMRSSSPQYAFWKAKGTSGMASNAWAVKKMAGATCFWMTRSVARATNSSNPYVATVTTGGIPNNSPKPTGTSGVSPAFCL